MPADSTGSAGARPEDGTQAIEPLYLSFVKGQPASAPTPAVPQESSPAAVTPATKAPEPEPDDEPEDTAADRALLRVQRRTEMSLLGALLVDPEAIDAVRTVVSAHDFVDRRHALVYAAVCAVRGQGDPPSFVFVSNRLAELGQLPDPVGTGYLSGLCLFCESSLYAPGYARQVARNAADRRRREARLNGGPSTDLSLVSLT